MDPHTQSRYQRYLGYAEAADRRAQQLLNASDDHSARFAGGQPILNGHSSAPAARNARNRSHVAGFSALDELRKRTYWQRKADAVLAAHEKAHDPNVIQRRLRRIDDELRRLGRDLEQLGSEGDTARALQERGDELRRIRDASRAELDRSGAKVWGPGDFSPGDFARRDGVLFEIGRVNKKSLTVGAVIGAPPRGVYRLADNPYSWTDRLRYEDVQDRVGAEEAAQARK